jgi:hypothetical protein
MILHSKFNIGCEPNIDRIKFFRKQRINLVHKIKGHFFYEIAFFVAGTLPISNRFVTDFIAIVDFSKFLREKLILEDAFSKVKVN